MARKMSQNGEKKTQSGVFFGGGSCYTIFSVILMQELNLKRKFKEFSFLFFLAAIDFFGISDRKKFFRQKLVK